MAFLVMVVIKDERQAMNIACSKYDGPFDACPSFPRCECGYVEGRQPPHYSVPAIPLKVDNYGDAIIVQRAYVTDLDVFNRSAWSIWNYQRGPLQHEHITSC